LSSVGGGAGGPAGEEEQEGLRRRGIRAGIPKNPRRGKGIREGKRPLWRRRADRKARSRVERADPYISMARMAWSMRSLCGETSTTAWTPEIWAPAIPTQKRTLSSPLLEVSRSPDMSTTTVSGLRARARAR